MGDHQFLLRLTFGVDRRVIDIVRFEFKNPKHLNERVTRRTSVELER